VQAMDGPTDRQIEVLKTVAAWAVRFPCIRTVYVFGSFARGDQMPHDIDIAVDYIEDVAKHTALKCYSDVNLCSTGLERSLNKIVSAQVGWTGLAVLRDGYDQKAWAAIHAGTLVAFYGKAQMIWTEPKPQNEAKSG
jgi:predicted nucleotidyltransferase